MFRPQKTLAQYFENKMLTVLFKLKVTVQSF